MHKICYVSNPKYGTLCVQDKEEVTQDASSANRATYSANRAEEIRRLKEHVTTLEEMKANARSEVSIGKYW